ncbi:MAG: hypothetical protein Q4P18_04630 [Methanobrevibacter sp.]|uniref:hypothetical protein n=1 Tax=Methanobrevibacter sp. TaxID=66852 RepID=UPI0026DF8C4C|nr:hypothetical protein [Methanobrevibacter sp.]MDO5848798.1 hypothetical protein [Methanobrevibacter sp.]
MIIYESKRPIREKVKINVDRSYCLLCTTRAKVALEKTKVTLLSILDIAIESGFDKDRIIKMLSEFDYLFIKLSEKLVLADDEEYEKLEKGLIQFTMDVAKSIELVDDKELIYFYKSLNEFKKLFYEKIEPNHVIIL